MAVDDEISTAERPDVDFRQHLASFVACCYDSKAGIRVLVAYEENFNNFFVNFLHPNGINPSYQFPEKKTSAILRPKMSLDFCLPQICVAALVFSTNLTLIFFGNLLMSSLHVCRLKKHLNALLLLNPNVVSI